MSNQTDFLIKYGNDRHLDQLAAHENQFVRAAVARKTKNPEHIERFLNDLDFAPRSSLAFNPNLSKEHVNKLVNSSDSSIRASIARMTPHKDHIEKLMNDTADSVRWNLAENPNIAKEHKDRLILDPHQEVRHAIFVRNPTDEYSKKLVNDPSKFIRNAVAIRSRNKEVLQKLTKDSSEMVRREAEQTLRDMG